MKLYFLFPLILISCALNYEESESEQLNNQNTNQENNIVNTDEPHTYSTCLPPICFYIAGKLVCEDYVCTNDRPDISPEKDLLNNKQQVINNKLNNTTEH